MMKSELLVGAAALFFLLLSLYLFWKLHLFKLRCLIAEEKIKQAKEVREELSASFRSLSHQALQTNNQIFLDLARINFEKLQEGAKSELEERRASIEQMITPVKDKLGALDEGLKALEKERKGDHQNLRLQLGHLLELERKLMQETSSLTKALRAPQTRGRWGEIQLRRVVELCGMLQHCDFVEQEMSIEGKVRPDLIVKLPGGRQIIIDAKAPMDAYLHAVETEDEYRRVEMLKEHARLVRSHAAALGKKSYHQHFKPTPEFVVLFLPSENFFSAALQQDPALIEIGIEQGVVLATPTTLIALLRAVAYGWKQESLSRHVEEVSTLGHELYKRIGDMAGHFSKTGRALSTAVESYNQTVRSLEARVLVSARKFQEMGAGSKEIEIPLMEPLEKIPLE
jgi:DNA recombination protein RmuC